MGANNPNNQLHGFPNNYVVNSNTQDLSKLIYVTGPGFTSPVTLQNCTAYRVGDRLVGQLQFKPGTTGAGLGWIQLPVGLTVNITGNTNVQAARRYGYWNGVTNGTLSIGSNGTFGVVFCDGVNLDRLYFAYRMSGGVYLQDNINAMFDATNFPDVQFDIPIAQWAT